jgi:hypothetical protein
MLVGDAHAKRAKKSVTTRLTTLKDILSGGDEVVMYNNIGTRKSVGVLKRVVRSKI